MFFKDSLNSKFINEYGLEKDLVKRRFQLLGYKLFKKCALGQPVVEQDLVKRVIYLNKTKNLGFVVKDLIKGCELSEKPKDDETTQIATEKLLNRLEHYSEEDLEKFDIIDEAYAQDKLPISRDVLDYGIKTLIPTKQFKLKSTKDRYGNDVLILVNKLNNDKVLIFNFELSEEVAKEFMEDVDVHLNMNFMDFYLNQSNYVKLQPYLQQQNENNLRLILNSPKESKKLKITVADVIVDPLNSGSAREGITINFSTDSVRDIYEVIFRWFLVSFRSIYESWLKKN